MQPLAGLCKVMGQWQEALQINQARLREVVCRRYHAVDASALEHGEVEDGVHVGPQEDEQYLGDFQAAR